ncbi:MAG: DUF1684 domain-containing protein [Bacteroidales bacterium]|nr:DUF1684 domain-containing protein [Bacteroidales bacterium]
MRNFSSVILIISLSLLHFGCNTATPVITDEAGYMEEIENWQQQRLEKLKGENGWLSLAGLFWLEQGENSFGSDPANNIVFPEKAEAFCGTLELDSGAVTLRVAEGVGISVKDSLITEIKLADDHSKNVTHLQQGDLAWYIIKRGDRYGIHLRDHKHPRIDELDHIPSYPVQTSYVVEAYLEPFGSPKTMTVATPLEGFTESYQCPGTLNFRLNGKELKLHPFTSGKDYFLAIADETTGLDTYGAGRFMYATPDSTGRIILDFNKAYNPPCAFSPFATCPMPPRENSLSVAIEAGEKSVHLH